MPIIIEGGSRSAGWWWAQHLQNTEKNERAELIESDGLSAESVPELFREMHAMSLGTKCKNYFYQANINPRADEHLTPEQRREAVETLGRNLGLGGQPYFVVEHEKEGRTHWHAVWLRVDLERMRAIPDSLTARIHEQTSRELESKFGLEPGQSILVPDREFERPERRATKHERFRGAQNGIDPHAIGNELKTLRERSDNGVSFQAGMEAAGYVLARGDRRDFVVIDQAGGDHNLARRLGMKAVELRQFMKEVDAKSLPSVTEARTRQQARQAGREARQKHGRAGQGIGAGQDNSRAGGPRKKREAHAEAGKEAKPERPLNPTQGDIRAAWTLSHTAEQLTEALAARGISLAQVTAEEARANQRARTFAKELGRFVRPQRESDIVAVNERGHVYHFDPRTTGTERGDIEKRLAGIDAASLLSVSDTREAMREAARMEAAEARRIEREKTRPASAIEQKIIDCERRAQQPPGIVSERDGESVQLNGVAAFAAALDQAGIAIVRVTAADVKALDALRQDEDLARLAADVNYEARRSQHFAPLEAGDIAAVDRFGNVHRLNPHKINFEQLEARLIEAGATVGSTSEGRLASVTEARADFEIERDAAAVLREEMMELRIARSTEFSAAPIETGPAVAGDEPRDAEDIIGRMIDGVASAALDFAADFIAPPPPLTKDQVEAKERGAEEAQARAATRRETDARLAQTIDMARAARASADREEEEVARARERQREQELGRDR